MGIGRKTQTDLPQLNARENLELTSNTAKMFWQLCLGILCCGT